MSQAHEINFSSSINNYELLDLPRAAKCCPEKGSYSLKDLLKLPSRIVNPPKLSNQGSSEAYQRFNAQKEQQTLFGKVREIRRTPMSDIKLEDILAGEHLPPLTLSEFEDNLVNVQHSVENLYFHFWLKDYTRQYNKWEASCNSKTESGDGLKTSAITDKFMQHSLRQVTGQPGNQKLSAALVMENDPSSTGSVSGTSQSDKAFPKSLIDCLDLAVDTFLPSVKYHNLPYNSQLELNISATVRNKFKVELETSRDPKIFSQLHKEVMGMLKGSMDLWLRSASGNADRNRTWFALSLGIVCIAMAILGLVLFVKSDRPATMRLWFAPVFWAGIMIFVGGLRRTCPVIFIFGSYRQIHVWELLRGQERMNSAHQSGSVTPKEQLGTTGDNSSTEKFSSETKVPMDPPPLAVVAPWQMSPPIGKSNDPNSMQQSGNSVRSRPSSENSFSYLYERLKSVKTDTKSYSPPIFSPVTAVLCPIVVRSQRYNMGVAVAWAFFAVALWMVIVVFIPRA